MNTRPVLDRLIEFDERSRQYPIRALLTTDQPRSYTWYLRTWLNQRNEGACVGFAWCHEAAAVPRSRTVDETFARTIYREAQHLDQWPGVDYEGTSVIAGVKAMKNRGYYGQYRWAFNLNDVLVAASRKGPVVLGLPWYTGMMGTTPDGYIHPTGRIEGGHAILLIGVNVKHRAVVVHNSWGRDWGRGGRAFLTWDDLGLLLDRNGEACIPTERL